MIRKFTRLVVLCLFTAFAANAQVAINSTGTAFTENFNTLASAAGTGSIVPSGWAFAESGSNANSTYTVFATASNGGDTYSFGPVGNSDRAFGGIQSGSLIPSLGAQFINNTGVTITSLTISYTGEQWRLGATGRADRIDFQYSTTATSLTTTGAYTDQDNLDFTAPVTAGTVGALDGNATANRTVVTNTITGLNIPNGGTIWLKWNDFNATGADDGLGIDDFSITATGGGADVTPPAISSTVPADNAINVSVNAPLQIVFSENVIKGAGNIVIKKASDNSVVQTIDVSTSAVTISSATATINIASLAYATDYYIEMPAGTFTDASLNQSPAVAGATTWNFTTAPVPAAGIIGANYSFTDCNTFLSDGWSQYSVSGAGQAWTCVAATGRTGDNGMQMNGFSGGPQLNEDWLISPAFDLTAATFPTLKFYSYSQFAGNNLVLKVSTNYVQGTDPSTATWTNLNGAFPGVNSNVWTLSDNIDLSAYNTTNVRFAWVYTSGTAANTASRWVVDDVSVYLNIPPAPCAEPAAQPASLMLTPATTTVSGSFTLIPATTTVVNYLVVRSTAPLTALPVDGVLYDDGDVINGGNGIAVEVNTDGTFTDTGLTPDTDYYYTVFAMEDQNCLSGPNYAQLAPLTGNTHTVALAPCTTPAAPASVSFTATNTSITGTITAPAPPASRYLVIRNTTGTGAFTGTITDGTTYTAGTVIGNGTVVSYLPSLNFTSTGLTVNTAYDFYIFSANTACIGTEPAYSTASLGATFTTTNTATGIPVGYYNAAAGKTCGELKTALYNIIKPTVANPAPTYAGICTAYASTDLKTSDFSSSSVIWDMYSDRPGPANDPYEFEYGIDVDGCGGAPNNPAIPGTAEGRMYNREHSFPRSWFGGEVEPMNSDIMHIFPTDKEVNARRSNYPYGEVSAPTFTSLNGSKLGPNSTPGYSGIVFEPIDEYKGDFARAHLYLITAYEDNAISSDWSGNTSGSTVMNDFLQSSTDQPNAAARKLQVLDDWYMQLMYKWSTNDPVSQKEIDRNNAVYAIQGNRNPFIDHPEYVAAVFSCSRALPVNLLDFTAQKNNASVLLRWKVASEISFRAYAVERSTDGVTFNKIGEVGAANATAYSFTDKDLPGAAAVVYYRLNMIDIDGTSKISKVVPVRLTNNMNSAVVYPNPTKDNLNIRLFETLKGNSMLMVADVTGRIVKTQSVNASLLNISVDVKNLPAGRYFIKIYNSQQVINQSFVVIR